MQNSIAKRYDSETSKSFPRGADLLIFFYELSFRLINSKGINTFITENAWLSTDYGKVFQDYLLKNIGVQGIIDSDYKYFETADINTVITFFRKEKRDDVVFFHCHDNFSDHHCNTLDSNANKGKIDILRFETSSSMLHSYKWGFLSSTKPELISLLNKMCKINDIEFQGKIEIGQGLNLTKDKVLTVQTKNTVPFYISDNGPKYNWESSLFYVDKENISETRRIPLMFLPRGLGTHFCCMNEIAGFTSSYVEIYEKENLTDIEKLCIWIFCNSSLLWLLREYTGRCNLGGGMLKAEATDLKSLPLCFRFGNIQEMQDIYNLSKGKSNPTDINDSLNTEIHKRIDKLVYDFFQLKDSDFFTQMLADRVKWRNKKSKSK